MKKLILIAGTGRSGTHLVGRTIASHDQITGRIETPETFRIITEIATTQDYKNKYVIKYKKIKLFRLINNIIKKSHGHILEKSHPSLWLADDFLTKYENAVIIGVWRNVEPTVNSMLVHDGVLSWYKLLPLNKVNRFLGITKNNVNKFKELSIEEKCALRWQSHKNELIRLKNKYPDRVLLVKYDDFLTAPQGYLSKISEFLNVTDEFKPEKFKIDSLDKWKTKLSDEQVKKIRNIIKADPILI